jgi:hypothetical protein
LKQANGWLVVLAFCGAAAPACGGGSGDCTPTCGPGFECYYGACVPRVPDSGLDAAGDGDAAPRDDGADVDVPDAHPEDGGCTVPEECADDDPCTQDLCDPGTGLCSHPPEPDDAPCPDGICCGAACRVGGDCCSDADCTGGCRGIARACTDVPVADCGDQLGCSGTGASGCGATGPFCYDLEVGATTCGSCGCTWVLTGCTGYGRVNCGRLGAELCAECGCTWSTGCDGVHEACEPCTDQATCDTQLDCRWSTCLDHLCT